jgi:RNA polymerase sigma factor (sigma-70 family)
MSPVEDLPDQKLDRVSETLLAKAAARGSRKAHERLVLSTLRTAVNYGKQFYAGVFTESELMGLCYGVLDSCAKKFDPSRQRFMAFCKCAIRGAIKRHWQTLDPVRNASVKRRKAGLQDCRPTFMNLETACQDALTSKAIVDPDETHELLGVSDPDWACIDSRERAELIWDMVRKIVTEREELILFCRYDQGFSFSEIGSLLGLSRTLVQTDYRSAMKKLKENIEPAMQLIWDNENSRA